MLSGFYLDCIQIRKRAANYFDSSNPLGVTKGDSLLESLARIVSLATGTRGVVLLNLTITGEARGLSASPITQRKRIRARR
jgi:hypothetical protein